MIDYAIPRVIVADPPWRFGDALPGPGRGASKHYSTMSLSDIIGFAANCPPFSRALINGFATPQLLFLWRVASMVPEALDVIGAWGFIAKAELVWVKTTDDGQKLSFGMGHYTRNCHETCIIATRGKVKVRSKSVRSVFEAPVGRTHSKKPDRFYEIVEELSEGPYLELFARRRRAGWTCLGDELE